MKYIFGIILVSTLFSGSTFATVDENTTSEKPGALIGSFSINKETTEILQKDSVKKKLKKGAYYLIYRRGALLGLECGTTEKIGNDYLFGETTMTQRTWENANIYYLGNENDLKENSLRIHTLCGFIYANTAEEQKHMFNTINVPESFGIEILAPNGVITKLENSPLTYRFQTYEFNFK